MIDSFFDIEHKPADLFTKKFIKAFSEEIICNIYCDRGDITGDDWEKIFAACIDVPWERSRSFYDVVDHTSLTAWSAKTIGYKNSKFVRLISGRNSPLQTFKQQINPTKDDPAEVGSVILQIWNDRVLGVKEKFERFKTIVLLRYDNLTEFRIFYYDTETYDHKNYKWHWTSSNNLHAFNSNNQMAFLWQPKGSQFTIMKEVPNKTQYISVNNPGSISRSKVLETVKFSDESYVSVYG